MTRLELFRLLVRRWYVVLLIAVLTAFGIGMVRHPQAVYYTNVNVMFLPPDGVLMDQTESLINFAALIERQYNQGQAPLRLSSNDATLYGAGVRSGSSVALYDIGGQWQTNFNRPVLQVEVVGPTKADVQDQIETILARIHAISVQTQQAAGVLPLQMIRNTVSPDPPVISAVQGNRLRATAGIVCLGLVLAVGTSYLVDRILQRVRPFRSSRPCE
ncbi:hypothetical protein [Specibacter sp. NPDC078692]|uniref:hypothetical protein n=1 Tax=Specibacter sp. NPDC078692 TaxID=3155818 RepID=UPI00342B0845